MLFPSLSAHLSTATKLPFEFVKAIQMLNELTSIIMVPITNFSSVVEPQLPAGYEPLADLFPTRHGHGFGCTGIVARNAEDGTVRRPALLQRLGGRSPPPGASRPLLLLTLAALRLHLFPLCR